MLLGSGFSRYLAGLPIQREFLRFITDDKKSRSMLDGPVPWAEPRKATIGKRSTDLVDWIRTDGDIERVMSILHNFAYSPIACPASKHVAKKSIVNLRTRIAIALREPPLGPSFLRKRNHFLRWLQGWGGHRHLVVLTTNYDRVIENVFSPRSAPWIPPEIPIDSRLSQTGTARSKPVWIDLYKLHGSIDWLEQREFRNREMVGISPLKITLRPPSDLERDSHAGFHGFRVNAGRRKIGTHPLFTPVLIPFFFQKEAWLSERWAPVLQRHWDSAFRRLSTHRVDRLAIIGTSFPQADHYLLSWILRLLHGKSFDNARRNKIVISCRDATYSVRQRLGLDARNSNTTALSLEDLRS